MLEIGHVWRTVLSPWTSPGIYICYHIETLVAARVTFLNQMQNMFSLFCFWNDPETITIYIKINVCICIYKLNEPTPFAGKDVFIGYTGEVYILSFVSIHRIWLTMYSWCWKYAFLKKTLKFNKQKMCMSIVLTVQSCAESVTPYLGGGWYVTFSLTNQ